MKIGQPADKPMPAPAAGTAAAPADTAKANAGVRATGAANVDASATAVAHPAGRERMQNHRIPGPKMLHARADFLDPTCALVAGRIG